MSGRPSFRDTRRRVTNSIMSSLSFICALLVLLPLALILFYLAAKGIASLNIEFFIQMPKPVGEPGGGMANAIVGTLILIGLACVVGLPIGILGGIYLAEFSGSRVAQAVRFAADVLNGIPSIVIGLFAYTMLVLPFKRFSALAGGAALGIIMLPVVLRTTEELIKLVPGSLREAALALGVPQWKVTIRIVLRTATGGIVTGVMIAVARIAGETAPLLFTAFGNQFWSTNLRQPIAALPMQIYTYAISPFDEWHAQAWAGALVLIALILLMTIIARFATKGRFQGGDSR